MRESSGSFMNTGVPTFLGARPLPSSQSDLTSSIVIFLAMSVSMCTLALVLLQLSIGAAAAKESVPAALNPQLTNTLDTKGGPILYYNGSGPVPP